MLGVYVGCNLNDRCAPVMPFKHNSRRRHRIGKMKFKVTNWPEVDSLLDQIDGPIGQFTADGAYDGKPTYDTVINHSAAAAIVIPPRANAVERADSEMPDQRDNHIAAIEREGRMKWQASTGYGKRSLVETAIGRYKAVIGRRLRACSLPAQQAEVAIASAILNRMLQCARPKSVHSKVADA